MKNAERSNERIISIRLPKTMDNKVQTFGTPRYTPNGRKSFTHIYRRMIQVGWTVKPEIATLQHFNESPTVSIQIYFEKADSFKSRLSYEWENSVYQNEPFSNYVRYLLNLGIQETEKTITL